MSRVTVVCSTCGPLYESSEIKADRHRTNAVTKAQNIAIEHTSKEPHEVVVDPGDAPEEVIVGKTKSPLEHATEYAESVLNTVQLLPSADVPDDVAVKILGNIQAAILTAFAKGFALGAKR